MENELDAFLNKATVNKDGLIIDSASTELVHFGNRASEIAENSKFVSFTDVVMETWSIVRKELIPRRPEGDQPRKLVEVLDAASIASLRGRILSYFGRLPRTYEFRFKLPNISDVGPTAIELAANVTLETHENIYELGFDDQEEEEPIGDVLIGTLRKRPAEDAAERCTILTVQGRGYFGRRHDTSACMDALSTVKQLIAFGLATGGFARSPGYLVVKLSSQAVGRDLQSNELNKFYWPRHLSKVFSVLTLGERVLKKPQGLFAFALGGSPNEQDLPREAWSGAISTSLNLAAKVAAGEKDAKVNETLRTGAEWAFDALAEENQTAAFLYAAIALEAMFLEANDRRHNVTARLTDRVSYALGRNRKERAELREGFQAFYDTRSAIVHGRSGQLKPHQSNHLEWVRETLNRVLRKELNGMQ